VSGVPEKPSVIWQYLRMKISDISNAYIALKLTESSNRPWLFD